MEIKIWMRKREMHEERLSRASPYGLRVFRGTVSLLRLSVALPIAVEETRDSADRLGEVVGIR
jgi:hypothetical protein